MLLSSNYLPIKFLSLVLTFTFFILFDLEEDPSKFKLCNGMRLYLYTDDYFARKFLSIYLCP